MEEHRPWMRRIFSRARLRHKAARLAGATGFALLAQFAVDMPEGYFGHADKITPIGAAYSIIIALTSILAVWGILKNKQWARWLAPSILSINIAFFLPAITTDPLIAGAIIVWQIIVIASHIFQREGLLSTDYRFLKIDRNDPLGIWLVERMPATQHLVMVSLFSTIAVVGYRMSEHWLAQAVCFALHFLAIYSASSFIYRLLQTGSKIIFIAALPLVASLFFLGEPNIALSLLAVYQVLILFILFMRGSIGQDLLKHFYDYPALFVLFSFGGAIMIGTLLLSFPAASAGEKAISAIDALFTATSSVCVTGLIVLDTPNAFSTFGHVVIICLIQIGGLGIMVLSAFTTMMLGGVMGLKSEKALGEVLDVSGEYRTANQLVKFIVSSTALIEFIGACIFTLKFYEYGSPLPQAVWKGVFHSISAFCNAGFALQSDSFTMFQHDAIALLAGALLISCGSIGFMMLATIWMLASGKSKPRILPLQVKVVLLASLILIFIPAALCAALEWSYSLKDLTIHDKLVNSLFISISTRTAGFNSWNIDHMRSATMVVFYVIMFIGGSPGGTAGGIKITTASILFATIVAITKGKSEVTMFNRRINKTSIYKSIAIVVISLSILCFAMFLLLLSQRIPFEELMFEAVSALGTVGLSVGATPKLNEIGKYIIIVLMFVGRIGPLTMALILGREKKSRATLPEETIMVG